MDDIDDDDEDVQLTLAIEQDRLLNPAANDAASVGGQIINVGELLGSNCSATKLNIENVFPNPTSSANIPPHVLYSRYSKSTGFVIPNIFNSFL